MKSALRILSTALFSAIILVSGLASAAFNVMPKNPIYSQNVVKHQGEVAMTIDGRYYLILEDESVFELKAAGDLSQFNGWIVEVAGYQALVHKVGPVFSPASLDPLSEEPEKNVAAPIFFVTSINGLSIIQ